MGARRTKTAERLLGKNRPVAGIRMWLTKGELCFGEWSNTRHPLSDFTTIVERLRAGQEIWVLEYGALVTQVQNEFKRKGEK
jgi:hypothetical protein